MLSYVLRLYQKVSSHALQRFFRCQRTCVPYDIILYLQLRIYVQLLRHVEYLHLCVQQDACVYRIIALVQQKNRKVLRLVSVLHLYRHRLLNRLTRYNHLRSKLHLLFQRFVSCNLRLWHLRQTHSIYPYRVLRLRRGMSYHHAL